MADQQEEEPALVGSPYTRVRLLGKGGMGTVLLARHRTLGTPVVIKLIHASYAQDPDALERLRVEAQTQAKLRSPHLLVCHDFGVTAAGAPYFATDYVEGVTLHDELARRGVFSVVEALEITRQMLEGLAVAHRAGIVHRDIKPSNLLLTREAGRLVLKILDFGVAKILPKVAAASVDAPAPTAFPTAEGLIVGTPRYCSPEQALAKPVDPRADLFSVGLVLGQMVTGRVPHADKLDMASLLLAQVMDPAEPPSRWNPEVPPELDELVLRALEKEPEHRYAGAREMLVVVEQVLALAEARVHLEAQTQAEVGSAPRFAPVAVAVRGATPTPDRTERLAPAAPYQPAPHQPAPHQPAPYQPAPHQPAPLAAGRDLSLPPDPTVRAELESARVPASNGLFARLGLPDPPRWFVVTVTALIFLVLLLSLAILLGPR